jgi:uncharacterized protein (TIGR03083 family)
MTLTTIDLRAVEPLDRRTAVELGRIEYRRMVADLRRLTSDDWTRPTDCEGWTVRDLAGHLAGAMMSAATVRAMLREQREVARRAKQTGEAQVDAMTALQAERTADLTPTELVDRMDRLVDLAADGRARLPGPLCRLVRIPVEMGPISETWRLEYLLGTILTRDTWLHRVADLSGALGRQPDLDERDRRIVIDVAAEWARRHGGAVDLVLTGPSGGRFCAGRGGPTIEVDAVEFCRMLSGRVDPTHPLLATAVPF